MTKIKKIIISLLIVVVFLASFGFGLQKYTEHLEYLAYMEHASNTYIIDYTPIEELHNTTYNFTSTFEDILIYTLKGTNLLGEEKDFQVTYELKYNSPKNTNLFVIFDPSTPNMNEQSSTNGSDSEVEGLENPDRLLLFDYMTPYIKNKLGTSKFVLKYKTYEEDYIGSITIMSNFSNVTLKPVLIDTKLPFRAIKYRVEVLDVDNGYKFDIPLSRDMHSNVYNIYAKDYPIVINLLNGNELALLSNKFIDIAEEDYFDRVYNGGFESVDSEYLEAVKNAFESLPLNIRKQTVFNGLKIAGTDYSFVDEAYVAQQNEQYSSNDTVKSYIDTIGGTYTYSEKQIYLNVSEKSNFIHSKYKTGFENGGYQSVTVNNDNYSKYKYNGIRVLEYHNISALKNYFVQDLVGTFFHELGHYIDDNSTKKVILTKDEMVALRKEYPYNYDLDYDYEHIAYAFEVYFEDADYMKENIPEMYEKLEILIENLNTLSMDDYEKYLNIYNNWN